MKPLGETEAEKVIALRQGNEDFPSLVLIFHSYKTHDIELAMVTANSFQRIRSYG